MTSFQEKWIDAVSKIIGLTQDGKLVWASEVYPYPADEPHGDRQPASPVFSTTYNGKGLRLYEIVDPIPIEEQVAQQTFSISEVLFSRPRPTARRRAVLEISHGSGSWKVPYSRIQDTLLEVVCYSMSGASEFLSEILREGHPEALANASS